MSSRQLKIYTPMWLLIVLTLSLVSAFAGSAVVGSVAGSMNATIGGEKLLPNTTIFSGDSLAVKDGAAVVAVGQGSRLVFGRETVASFLRDEKEVTVLLGQGNVSLYHSEAGATLRVKVGEVSITPAGGFKTLGEVAMLNGVVVVTAKEGKLRVEGNGPAVEVVKGKTITVAAKTARAPQGAGSGAASISGTTALQIVGTAASGVSVVTSTAALSKAGDAEDAALAAENTASQAANSAASAATAANAASATADDILNVLCTSTVSNEFPACQ
jgi:hypothetical protein